MLEIDGTRVVVGWSVFVVLLALFLVGSLRCQLFLDSIGLIH